MALNPSIILAGRQPDIINTLARSTQAASGVNQVRDQNALRQLYQTQGPGIVSGDQGALNALAQLDPNAAFGIGQRQQAGRRADQANTRAQATFDANMSKQQQYEELTRALEVINGAQTPEQWDQAAQQYGANDLVGQFGNKQAILDKLMPFQERLASEIAREQPPQPGFDIPAGSMLADPNNPRAGVIPVPGAQPAPAKQSEAEQEIARLISTGMTREMAIGLKEGRLKAITNPVDGSFQIVDMATGQPVQYGGQEQPAPEPVQEKSPYSFGEAFPSSDTSFGAEGMIRRGINAGSDFLGVGAVFPETQQTQADFAGLRERLTASLQEAYGQRLPSWLLKGIQDLTPQAGTMQGAGTAQTKLSSLGRSLQTELETANRMTNMQMRPTQRQELERRIAGLESALGRIDEALSSFGGGSSGEVPQLFADRLGPLQEGENLQDIWDNLSPEAQRKFNGQ